MPNDAPDARRIWTILDIISWTTDYFKSRDVESPRASAEILLAHILNISRIDLYVKYDKPLTPEERDRYKETIRRRINREPVAYITGTKGFWSLDLCISDKCLIPRPETELLVETALTLLPETTLSGKPMTVLELGTGSGAVILALATERPGHAYVATDRCEDVLSLAKKNAGKHDLSEQVCFFAGDWFAPVNRACRFDMILSNPPYIPTGVIPTLQPEVCRFEPALALDGGEEGLDCIRRLISSAAVHLFPGGALLLEIGHDQKTDVEKIVHETGAFDVPCFVKDYGGQYRVAWMRKSG